MEWDFSQVTKGDALNMARNNPTRRRSSLAVGSEFGDAEQAEKKEDIRVLLDPFYDVTTGRLRRLFHHFSPNGKDTVTYVEFQRGLSALGISVPRDGNFDEFVAKVDTNGDGLVSVDEFIAVVQMIKQAHLFKPDVATPLQVDAKRHVLRVVDYSPTSLRAVDPVTKLQSFMVSAKPQWATVRWVHLAGFQRTDDDLNLRRLAIKYQLHPLALEDCLNQHDKLRCKFEHYDDHSFLAATAKKLKEAATENHPNAVAYPQPHKPPHAIYGSARPGQSKAAALTATLDALDTLLRPPQQLCVFVSNDHVVSVQEDVDTIDPSAFRLWDLVVDQTMTKPYSKVRNHSAAFLVVSILNAVVDEMLPLVEVCEPTLNMLGKLVRLQQTAFDPARFARTKKQLIAMDKIIRPLLDLVTDHLTPHDQFNRDHLRQMSTDLRDHQLLLATLVDDDKQARAKQQEDVMYYITVVAACFLPGTFLTGIYGMNFKGTMPELEWEDGVLNGYKLWWIVLVSVLLAIMAYVKGWKQWM
ncbi:hypothetical protein DYB38_007845 [Aphanomyces astaci]|uniref:EF-hand domain-containing protein n=1 Tax=Aphanomyces astaci TaxID=112090 RepID=A0A397C5L1_APHAT|nr:hypothetical protein DYB38_007845 [Aphanomyces astaci]RHZ14382.1 hypothetical protein DYB31_005131 [Aphanomyces astaci]